MTGWTIQETLAHLQNIALNFWPLAFRSVSNSLICRNLLLKVDEPKPLLWPLFSRRGYDNLDDLHAVNCSPNDNKDNETGWRLFAFLTLPHRPNASFS